jgi:hypothetical protein
VGEVIDLLEYRANMKEKERNGIYMQIVPPAVLIQFYRYGVIVEQHRVISEHMLRDLLDDLN